MMTSEEIAVWINDTLSNLPSDGGDNTPRNVLKAVYGFDAQEFEDMVQAIWDAAFESSDDPDKIVGRFSVIMFEVGHAWSTKQRERFAELFHNV